MSWARSVEDQGRSAPPPRAFPLTWAHEARDKPRKEHRSATNKRANFQPFAAPPSPSCVLGTTGPLPLGGQIFRVKALQTIRSSMFADVVMRGGVFFRRR